MRKLFLFVILLTYLSFILSCQINQIINQDEQILFQNYQIQVYDGKTSIEAEVYYQDDLGKDMKKTLPEEVRFNNQPMLQQPVSKYSSSGISVSEKDDQTYLEPNNININGVVQGYKISQPFYKSDNQFIVTDQNGKAKEFNLTFDPVEFENPEGIVISKSKDNFIKIKGKGGRNTLCSLGFGAESGTEIEDLIKVDFDKMQVLIPYQAIKSLKTGEARFFIISSDHDFIDDTVRRNGQNHLVRFVSSYRITYSTETKIKIVD